MGLSLPGAPAAVGGAAALLLLLALLVGLVRGSDAGDGTVETAATRSTTLAGKLGGVFRPTDGYSFDELPPRLVAEMARTTAAVEADPRVKAALRGIAGRSVMKDGSWVGVVLAFDIEDKPGFGERFLRDAPAAIGPNARDLTVDGRRVVSVTNPDGLTTLVYYGRGLAIVVGGSNDAGTLAQVMNVLLENAA